MPTAIRRFGFFLVAGILLAGAAYCHFEPPYAEHQRPPGAEQRAEEEREKARVEALAKLVVHADVVVNDFFIVPGSRVDVIHVRRDEMGEEITTTLPNVFVLATPDGGCTWLAPPRTQQAVTLGVTPDQATKLTEMTKSGKIKLRTLPDENQR
jgi:Flp pilus assembly protein CpaB